MVFILEKNFSRGLAFCTVAPLRNAPLATMRENYTAKDN
jgi:hypothetical protein